MSTAEILADESPEDKRLRLSVELGRVLSRRHELMLQLSASRRDGELARFSRDRLAGALLAVELEYNQLVTAIAAANSQIPFHEKEQVYREVYNVPEPEPQPEPWEFDDDEDD